MIKRQLKGKPKALARELARLWRKGTFRPLAKLLLSSLPAGTVSGISFDAYFSNGTRQKVPLLGIGTDIWMKPETLAKLKTDAKALKFRRITWDEYRRRATEHGRAPRNARAVLIRSDHLAGPCCPKCYGLGIIVPFKTRARKRRIVRPNIAYSGRAPVRRPG